MMDHTMNRYATPRRTPRPMTADLLTEVGVFLGVLAVIAFFVEVVGLCLP